MISQLNPNWIQSLDCRNSGLVCTLVHELTYMKSFLGWKRRLMEALSQTAIDTNLLEVDALIWIPKTDTERQNSRPSSLVGCARNTGSKVRREKRKGGVGGLQWTNDQTSYHCGWLSLTPCRNWEIISNAGLELDAKDEEMGLIYTNFHQSLVEDYSRRY